MNQLKLNKQVAVITGASSGLGRETALELANCGAGVALMARGKDELLELQRIIVKNGQRAQVFNLDLTNEEEIGRSIKAVVEEFGRIDILVNNAATDVPKFVPDLSCEEWDQVINVNLRAPFLLAKHSLPHMIQAKSGTIINVSSVGAKRAWARGSAYCSSKLALRGLTEAIMEECRPHGIRASLISPGYMATNWGLWDPTTREERSHLIDHPRESMALRAIHVARLIVWIASLPQEVVPHDVVITAIDDKP